VLEAAALSRYPGIGRGYLEGLAQHHPDQLGRANEVLDRLQWASPRAVFEMLAGGPKALKPLGRTLALVADRRLPVEALRGVSSGGGAPSLTAAELRQVLDRLLAAASQGNEAAARAAVHVLWRELRLRSFG
jgi:hypothetical protein